MAEKRVGVVLAGCGYLDGAEIHEATLTLFFLHRKKAKATILAPDVPQMHVVDHCKGQPAPGETRGVLAESARIARGQVTDIARVKAADLDALVFPGGFGAAKNLCTFATDGKAMKVNPEVERLVRETRQAGKPLGFICIAPVIGAKVLGEWKPRLTIGNDRETAAALESFGAAHVDCAVDQICVDEKNKIVSTPAYMLGPWIADVGAGIEKLVSAVLEMA